MPTPDPAVVAWSAALNLLEEDLAVAAGLLAAGSDATAADRGPWAPGADLGPLPAALAPRAHDLLDRQRAVLAALPTAITANRQHARLAGTVSAATRAPDRPAYLDIQA